MFPDLTRDDVFRLETRRLWLRWPRLADGPALLRALSETALPGVMIDLPAPYALGEADAEGFIYSVRQSNADGRGLDLMITPKAKPKAPVGLVGIRPDRETGRGRLSFWLAPSASGQGLGAESAQAVIDAFFSYTEEPDLTAVARAASPAVRRVLEKCGFSPDGRSPMPGQAAPNLLAIHRYRLDRATWQSPWVRAGNSCRERGAERLAG